MRPSSTSRGPLAGCDRRCICFFCGANSLVTTRTNSSTPHDEAKTSVQRGREVDRRQPAQRPKVPESGAEYNRAGWSPRSPESTPGTDDPKARCPPLSRHYDVAHRRRTARCAPLTRVPSQGDVVDAHEPERHRARCLHLRRRVITLTRDCSHVSPNRVTCHALRVKADSTLSPLLRRQHARTRRQRSRMSASNHASPTFFIVTDSGPSALP